MERSLFSARFCFVENLFRQGYLAEPEYVVLDEWFKYLSPDVKVDLIVYLKTKPETCFERIKSRCRQEETSLSLDYLQSLHKVHEEWLGDNRNGNLLVPAPVFVIENDVHQDDIQEKLDILSDIVFKSQLTKNGLDSPLKEELASI